MSVSRDGAHYGGRHVRRAARPTCFARDKLPHIPLLVSRYDTVLSAGDSGVKVKMFLNSFNTLIEDDAYDEIGLRYLEIYQKTGIIAVVLSYLSDK